MQSQNKFTELKNICDKAFKRNSIYPLMEIPKPDSKDTIEEQYKQAEIFPVWNDVNRVDASKIWKQLNDLYIKAEDAKRKMKLKRINRCKSLYYSGAVLVPIKSYDMIIVKIVI